MMRNDSGPVTLALKEAVKMESEIQITLEEVPAGDHQANQANGIVDSVINEAQGLFRAAKDALERRHERTLDGEHPAALWLVMHAASVINRGRKDSEGFSAYRKMKGTRVQQTIAQFGECAWYLPAVTVGLDEFDMRWREGAWPRILAESGESIAGTSEGVAQARGVRRKPENVHMEQGRL